MDSYAVKLSPHAYRDLDEIYGYIAVTLREPGTAQRLIGKLEQKIYSLNELPERGAPRKTGPYARNGYRQLFFRNFTVIYRVEASKKLVVIVTIRYSRSQF